MTYTHLTSRVNSLRTYTFFAVLLFVFLPTISFALTPIAHTDVVSYQRIEYGTTFNFGVVAFSKAGIDRVDFVISGQGYSGGTKSSSSMTLNTRVASTSPGAEYPGVYEYFVTISASEFTSNGTFTVTPTVYGNDADSRVLDSVTLYVEGASDESPVEAWISKTGNDSTGTVGNQSLPYATLAGAVSDIQAANGGNCDGAIVYYEEGTYYESGVSATTSNDRFTITRASGADIENVIFTELGISTARLKVQGITMQSQGIKDRVLTNEYSWVDHCRLLGAGRTIGDDSNPVTAHNGYQTGNYVYDVYWGVYSGSTKIARGLKINRISNDTNQNANFLLNIQVNDIDPAGTAPCPGNGSDDCHADAYQSWGNGPHNLILYNYVVTDANYQGLFIRQEYGTPGSNVAIVNMFVELRGTNPYGGGFNGLYGEWNHLILWHNTFVGTGSPSHWGWACMLHNVEQASGVHLWENSSYIGNVFTKFVIGNPPAGDRTYMNSGNSNGNLAEYNHFMDSYHNIGEYITTGTGVIDITTPGSDTYGYPVPGSVIINRLPSNLTGVLGDALGNPRDSRPDVGALEGTSPQSMQSPGSLEIVKR